MVRILRADRRGPRLLKAEVVNATVEARAILERARTEARALREQARLDGHVQGREEAKAELAAELTAHAHACAQALDALEPQAIEVALQAARRLVGDALEGDDGAVRDLVADLLARLRRARRVTIRIHPDDEDAARQALALDAQREGQTRALTLESDPTLERGDCVLESDMGTIDARIETRIAALARALEQR
ncbi:MAG: FliH/SctL family protein [Myxococcales bacterium]|nr:FliH/SctL family protein [Myxococcales bacterium]